MRIEAYFATVARWVEACYLVERSSLTYQVRQAHLGYLRGELTFRDGSILHVREFVDVELTIDRLAYAYHWMNSERHTRFRYDNTDHHPHITTHPHHKHVGQPERIEPSQAPTLQEVLLEIEQMLDLADV